MSKKIIKITFFLLGGALLIFWITQLGLKNIFHTLGGLGLWTLALLGISLLWNLFYSMGWSLLIKNNKGFFRLLKIKIMSEAVALMTPFNFALGDPVRYFLIKSDKNETHGSAIVADRFIHTLASLFHVLIGLIALFIFHYGIPHFISAVLVSIYFLLFLFIAKACHLAFQGEDILLKRILEWSLLNRFIFFQRLKIKFLESISGLKEIGFSYPAFLLHWLGRFLGTIEIGCIFWYLYGSPHWLISLVLSSLTSVVHLFFSFIPGALGLVEGLYAAFFMLNGLNAQTGLAMQMIRRSRFLFWVLIGYLLFYLEVKPHPLRQHKKT
ncbi:MAG: hypothetical protein A3G32_08200 [Deltaproteobacteria bacterium RIFCSPLOWO2_12_FULL_40_28]|nr:MAG: hypothetical protein A3C45_00900 [Deltaproteobacteria bacterium RIFCSPHIGHO2_02_FULL_40_28]OGQ20891.1 MAG: hypothetical protein A3E27_03565 [Deltaproteobacteria bacterium RIFCSPHIGHO2_12_FULL_40_32]OGQ39292.1 MAG: hypothetical protein A3I69_04925 [Deltaproteobacteria bacterium RIFCSPLOWO2_02_FULL_40_36]OGQ54573.1 MAG: hypothetical protein A3G32_08200 [Deltaproteobacteria bacterium RIFCSPLOWO2_12_FULL_40_28]